MQITYTLKTNIEEGRVIDESLVTSARVSEEEIEALLGEDNQLLSKWDDDEYDRMQVKMEKERLILLQEAKDRTIKAIDADTKAKILSIAGDLEKQANYNAKYTELLDKKVDGSITVDEEATMTAIKQGWETIEKLREDGNRLEDEVQAMATIEEVFNILSKYVTK